MNENLLKNVDVVSEAEQKNVLQLVKNMTD